MALALAGVALSASPARGQIDYRNLDLGRPLRVEDAYPIERYAFGLTGGYQVARSAGGGAVHSLEPHLEYGVARGLAASIGAPLVLNAPASGGPSGIAGIGLALLANLTTDRIGVPAVGVRLDVTLPAGAAGPSSPAASLALLGTRNFGRIRLHLNAGAGLLNPARSGAAEPGARWHAGVLADWTLLRSSTLAAVEVTLRRDRRGEPVVAGPGIGVRRQLTPTVVLDLGLIVDLAAGSRPAPALRAGYSRSFAVAALMPGRRR